MKIIITSVFLFLIYYFYYSIANIIYNKLMCTSLSSNVLQMEEVEDKEIN